MITTGYILTEPLRMENKGHKLLAFILIKDEPIPVICWDELADTLLTAGDHVRVDGNIAMRVTKDRTLYELTAKHLALI